MKMYGKQAGKDAGEKGDARKKRGKGRIRKCLAAAMALLVLLAAMPVPAEAMEGGEAESALLAEFDFDDETDGFSSEYAKATGSYSLQDSYSSKAGKALYLDGSPSHFLTVTDKEGGSLLAGLREMTISYEFKPGRVDTNWVLYAAPNGNAPTYKREQYLGVLAQNGATKLERYHNTGNRPATPEVKTGEDWSRVDIVLTEKDSTIYLNGQKTAAEASAYGISDILGEDGILQIGKANWGTGEYCKGWIDNFRIEGRALSEEEIAGLCQDFADTLPAVASVTVGTAPERAEALGYRGTDGHTAIISKVDWQTKEITPYVRKGADIANIPVEFVLNGGISAIRANGVSVKNGQGMDLTQDTQVTFVRGEKEESWTLKKPILCNNPVLPGQYADPDIDYFDGKFWLYPTTDGYPNWSGTAFHAFSSEDMVDWEDEGVIMELANSSPGLNEKGVQIASAPWAVNGSAWAPTIEKKDGKYYFYYCGKNSARASCIGVAVADHPAGPYKDKGEPLLTLAMCREAGISMGQTIDPSVFTDDDGRSYIVFGNGGAAIAELTEDMMDIKEGTLKPINGLKGLSESVVLMKIGDTYHWTWTCNGADDPNYRLNYGTSDRLIEENGVNVTLKREGLLSKEEGSGILATGHQSLLHIKDAAAKDRYFVAYHRFYTPLDIFVASDGLGKHRETCIDEIFLDENGEMLPVTPTLEGVSAIAMPKEGEGGEIPDDPNPPIAVTGIQLDKSSFVMAPKKSIVLAASLIPSGAADQTLTWHTSDPAVASVSPKEAGGLAGKATARVTAKKAGTAVITAEASNGVKASCKVTVKVPVSKVKLGTSKLTLGVKEKFDLKASVAPKDATDKKISYSMSKKGIVSVSKGVITARKKGTVTVTASAGGKKASCKVTVKAAPKKITLSAARKTLKRGKSYQIKVKLPKGTASSRITYTSSQKSVAKVSASGKVKALRKGKATITVKAFNGKKAKLQVFVK